MLEVLIFGSSGLDGETVFVQSLGLKGRFTLEELRERA